MKSNYIALKQLIRTNELSLNDLEKIIGDYSSYGLTKSKARKLVNIIEKKALQNTGILTRNMKDSLKEKLLEEYKLDRLIVKEGDENIDQTLKIGDLIYTFRVKDKLTKLR